MTVRQFSESGFSDVQLCKLSQLHKRQRKKNSVALLWSVSSFPQTCPCMSGSVALPSSWCGSQRSSPKTPFMSLAELPRRVKSRFLDGEAKCYKMSTVKEKLKAEMDFVQHLSMSPSPKTMERMNMIGFYDIETELFQERKSAKWCRCQLWSLFQVAVIHVAALTLAHVSKAWISFVKDFWLIKFNINSHSAPSNSSVETIGLL